MSVQANKELVRRFYETIEQENYGALKDFCHEDFVFLSSSRYTVSRCRRFSSI
ncbi:nuclear transport factor 2-like protein [Priestia endophytica]|uniref:hypothetical protein n=1 Tax=Priestia endophytica TaxID=135735 RepID=UPI00178C3899|nr:hypothetical protein [Priestia endophytica]